MTVYDHEEFIEGIIPDVEDLSLFFAKIMTSPHNQHVIVRVVGKAGKGKSWLGGALSYGVSECVAEIIGGKPEDYFNMKENLAVISKQEVMRVMNNPKKHSVLFLDDVAAHALNARNYRNADNIDLNSILTTFRPNHNLVILTTQAGFLIDKVPRSMSHYLVQMDRPLFDHGMSIVKCFELEFDENTGQLFRHYLRSGGSVYKRHICIAPPKEFSDAYEAERAIQLQRMNEAKQESEKAKTLKKKDYAVATIDGIIAEYGATVQKACKIAGIDPAYYNRMKA